MKTNGIISAVSRTANQVAFQLKKHSPQIMVIGGLVAGAATIYTACKATLKVDAVIDETKEKIEKIHEAVEDGITQAGEEYTVEDSKKDLTRVYLQTAVKIGKLYAPAIVLGAVSTTSILGGYSVLRKRNAAITAACAAIDKSFKEYRGRVVDRFGEDLDRELKYNIKAEEVEETVVDGKGKEKTVKKTVDVVDSDAIGEFAKFFDETSTNWEDNAEYNLMFIRANQNYANDLLRARAANGKIGRVFLNEVYDMVGVERTKTGQVAGWIYDPNDPSEQDVVDFGIYNTHRANRRFVNGLEPVLLMDFNARANIWKTM